MRISTLTVCFNSAATIRHTIESFLAQTHDDKELLVIDGGSSDDTCAIVESYQSPLISLVSEPDRGMYDGLNKGLRRFSGEAVGVLNSDDRYTSDESLSLIARALARADIVHGDLRFVSNHNGGQILRTWDGTDPPASGFRSGWMPAHPTFYARREVVDAVGEFDLSYKTASDYHWMIRAVALQEFRLGRIDACLVDMMVGGRSTSGIASYLHHNLEALKVRQTLLGAGPVDLALLMKPARKLGQFFKRG
jgi:glycosyltransferase involved in cell wall biosynthesis